MLFLYRKIKEIKKDKKNNSFFYELFRTNSFENLKGYLEEIQIKNS